MTTADAPAPEPLGERAERLAQDVMAPDYLSPTKAAIANTLRELADANAALVAQRDALLDEWTEIAAGLTTEEPEIGALWPMVSEVSGALSASRNLFRNEIAAHNRTKTERDAALARVARLEGALRVAREHIGEERASLVECDTIPDANEWRDESTMGDLTKEAVAEIDAILSDIDAALATEPQS